MSLEAGLLINTLLLMKPMPQPDASTYMEYIYYKQPNLRDEMRQDYPIVHGMIVYLFRILEMKVDTPVALFHNLTDETMHKAVGLYEQIENIDIEKGRLEGRDEGIIRLLKNNVLSVEQIAQIFEVSSSF